MRAKYRHFRTIWGHSFCWVVLLASSQNLSTHFFAWPSISKDHVEMFESSFTKPSNFSVALAEILDPNIFRNCRQYLCLFRILVECNPSIHDPRKILVLPNRVVSSVLSTLDRCSVSFQPIFMSYTYTDKNNPFSRFTNEPSQFGTFSQPCSNGTFSNNLSHDSPARGWPYRFRSRGTTGSSIPDHDFGHLCRGRRIQMSGHSDFGTFNNVGASFILTWVWADTASAACPAHPGSLALASITVAAVICNAEEPCSVNTAWEPESSFTMSPRSTIRLLYFWCCGSNSEFLRWQTSINVEKLTFFLSICASRMTSFWLLTLSNCQAGIVSSFFHSLATAAFASRISSLEASEKLVNQIVMGHRIIPFACDVIFVFCGWTRFHSSPCGFMRFHYACMHACMHACSLSLESCWIHSYSLRFPASWSASLFFFKRHSRLHWNFQLSPWVFRWFLHFHHLLDQWNKCLNLRALSSCGFSFSKFLLFVLLNGFSRFGPHLRPQFLRSGSCLNGFCSSLTTSLFGEFSYNNLNFVNPFHEPDKLRSASIPIIINTFLLQHVQIWRSTPGHNNVLQWNRECFFLRHMELNSRINVLTIDEVTLNRPEVFPGFSDICLFSRLRPFRFSLKFSTEIVAPYKLFLP